MFFKSIWLTILMLFIVAVVISVMAYPEVLCSYKVSFMTWYDYCAEYFLSFILTNFFYQGGLQLWDHFGQMPFAYMYATFGAFKLPNIMTALTYYVCSPFTDNSAQLFQQIFAWVNILALLFMRIVGIFLVLSCVTKRRWILCAGTVVSAVFYSQPAFMWGTYFMSYIPLFMYFIIRFFDSFQGRYLAAIMLFYGVCFGSGIVHTGYINVGIHFFIVSGLLWSMIFNQKGWQDAGRYLLNFEFRAQWKRIALLLLVFAVIVSPYLYIIKFCFKDVAFGADHSRIAAGMFNPNFYFKQLEISLADPRSFFTDTLNFDGKANPTVYFGWMVYFLALTGLILSGKNIKWFFTLAIIFLWLLNHPRELVNIGTIAHWINALTNPLKTFPHSYLVASYCMLSYLLVPLAIMGTEEIVGLYSEKKHPWGSWVLVIALLVAFVGTSASLLPDTSKAYFLMAAVIFIGGIIWMLLKNSEHVRRCFLVITCLLVIMDVAIIISYSRTQLLDDFEHKFTVLDSAPQLGAVGYNFENPKIFPFREFQINQFSYNDDTILWFPKGISSNYTHVTNQALNFLQMGGHSPRHVEFSKWIDDREMFDYLSKNHKTFFLAPFAVKVSDGGLKHICDAGLEQDVVMVDDPLNELKLPDRWPDNLVKGANKNTIYDTTTGTLHDVIVAAHADERGGMIIFCFPLPANVPRHLASSWFADEQKNLRFLVQAQDNKWVEFQQVQGELIKPYTFDVQNIKEGQVTAAFPKDGFSADQKYVFMSASNKNDGVYGLWSAQYDHLGIDYRASQSGWLVFHSPYDTKFKITLNGKAVKYYRVNKSFIGFPITAGEHKILIEYCPGSPLGIMLAVSAITTTVCLFVLIILGLRWARTGMSEGHI